MSKYWTIKDLKRLPGYLFWTAIFCMVVTQGMGIIFSVMFWLKLHHWIAITPIIGFGIMAWQYNPEVWFKEATNDAK